MSKVQRLLTNSDYDHVAMLLKTSSGELFILESSSNMGVSVYSLKSLVNLPRKKYYFRYDDGYSGSVSEGTWETGTPRSYFGCRASYERQWGRSISSTQCTWSPLQWKSRIPTFALSWSARRCRGAGLCVKTGRLTNTYQVLVVRARTLRRGGVPWEHPARGLLGNSHPRVILIHSSWTKPGFSIIIIFMRVCLNIKRLKGRINATQQSIRLIFKVEWTSFRLEISSWFRAK